MPTEHRKKILIVDDEEITRTLMQRNTTLAGYDVIVASNGREAMEKIQGVIPDLIVADLMMPDMNGFELCRRLRNDERTKKIPVFVVSALQSESDIEQARLAGADLYLTKPIPSEVFVSHIKQYLGSPFKASV
jgi:CheY-like chemotaxis protein